MQGAKASQTPVACCGLPKCKRGVRASVLCATPSNLIPPTNLAVAAPEVKFSGGALEVTLSLGGQVVLRIVDRIGKSL